MFVDLRRILSVTGLGLTLVAPGSTALAAQPRHPHTAPMSGMPQGVPLFCADATITSAASGSWSKPATWSAGRVPKAGDRVAVAPGHVVTYDTVSDETIECVEVRGTLAFSTAASTRLKVVTVLVVEGGSLEIGTVSTPLAAEYEAEVTIADQPFDTAIDPGQVGHGIVVLGTFHAHGAPKTPTFVRLAEEARAGQTQLVAERAVNGWHSGDTLVLPDTRQLRTGEREGSGAPQHETVTVASVSGSRITLAAPLAFDHRGARNAQGAVEFLPHLGNLSRNVIVRSENPRGTRGHTMFIAQADVDIRYTRFEELGRTRLGVLDTPDFDSSGNVARQGTNPIGRYAVHFHHDFGPAVPPANGYQFTLVGNAVDGAPKWGITVHRSHYGLIKDNVVFNTRGAGIVTEDGSESFNEFDHNFSVRTTGSTAAVGNGYSATLPNPGGEGSSFWFRGPNNYIRNNVAANATESGFGLPVIALGAVRVPGARGANTSRASESLTLDTARARVLEFSGNEAYGALQNGVTWAWSGVISGLTVWHASRHAVAASPSDTLTIDALRVRGDPAVPGPQEQPAGVWVANYAGKTVAVRNANVQGVRTGVHSPFFYGQRADASGPGTLTVEDSYFRTRVGVSVATSYVDDGPDGRPLKSAIVRNSLFEPPGAQGSGPAFEGVSMNDGMRSGDARPRLPVVVLDYNRQPGNNFSVYYSFGAPPEVAPCHDTVPGVGGWVCR